MYRVRKGEIVIETDDRALVMELLGVKAPKPKHKPEAKPRETAFRETEKSYFIGKACISKEKVSKVFDSLKKLGRAKRAQIIADTGLHKVLVGRSLQILCKLGKIERKGRVYAPKETA